MKAPSVGGFVIICVKTLLGTVDDGIDVGTVGLLGSLEVTGIVVVVAVILLVAGVVPGCTREHCAPPDIIPGSPCISRLNIIADPSGLYFAMPLMTIMTC